MIADYVRSLILLEQSPEFFSVLQSKLDLSDFSLLNVHLRHEVFTKVALNRLDTRSQHISVVDISPGPDEGMLFEGRGT